MKEQRDTPRPTMSDEEMVKDYPRLAREYTLLHQDYREAIRKPLTIPVVSFSLFDKVYMDSPFGRYIGIVKGVEESKVIIESHSPTGNGTMLAGYDLSNNDWQKY